MPVGKQKNLLYGLALPLLGKPTRWMEAETCFLPPAQPDRAASIARALRRQKTVGASLSVMRGGRAAETYVAGYARLPRQPVTPETVFRTASIAKLAVALLTLRLEGKGLLDTQEDISETLGFPLRNPLYPDVPITWRHLLSHSSSIVDTPAYFASFSARTPLYELLKDDGLFLPARPGAAFRYSNLAAGMIGCLLEKKLDESLEALAQRELFAPLGIDATFDLTHADPENLACAYRVLPPKSAPAFDAQRRFRAAEPILQPDWQQHYLLGSGSLYLTSRALVGLTAPLLDGHPYLTDEQREEMRRPLVPYPDDEVKMWHGLGLLIIDDPAVCPAPILGHQGFAYGAVNGVFLCPASATAFALLNSGASEKRKGRLGEINRQMIRLLLP